MLLFGLVREVIYKTMCISGVVTTFQDVNLGALYTSHRLILHFGILRDQEPLLCS